MCAGWAVLLHLSKGAVFVLESVLLCFVLLGAWFSSVVAVLAALRDAVVRHCGCLLQGAVFGYEGS